MSWLVLDFETSSALDVTVVGSWAYAEHPTTSIVTLCYYHSATKTPRLWTHPDPELLRFSKDPECVFVAFNCAFEKAIWRKIMVPSGYPDIPNERWHDIQAVAAMKQLPQALGKLGAALKLVTQKAEFDVGALSRFDKKTGASLLTPALQAACDAYCQMDILAEAEAHQRLGTFATCYANQPYRERAFWLQNQRVNERGVRLDQDLIHKSLKIVEQAAEPLLAEFKELTGLKPTQVAKFRGWLQDQEVHLDSLAKGVVDEALGDEDAIEGTLFTGGVAMDPEPRRALEIRRLVGHASIKKLDRMLKCLSSDGRSRGLLQYHGTGPGRSAGRLWQPQNLAKPSKQHDIEQLISAIRTGDPLAVEMLGVQPIQGVADSLRHIITCDDDKVLMANDYAGIQARLVLALAGQWDKVALLAAGKDVYCDMGSTIFKRPVTKADAKERGTGKNAVLGLGFQMGDETFQVKYARDSPLSFATMVVQAYRKEWAPKVPKLWYGLHDTAALVVFDHKPREHNGILYAMEDMWLTCRLPSGRKIWYFGPKSERTQFYDNLKLSFSYLQQKNGQSHRVSAFGGGLTENVIMGMECDIVRAAQIKCENEGLPVVLETHDELVIEPLLTRVDAMETFTQIMLDTDQWVKDVGVPIAVEGWVARNYRK